LSPEYFAEGLTAYGDKLIQLTWKSQKAFLYDRKSLQRVSELHYSYEGWGITFDGKDLIVSDGSATLRFLDPESFEEKREITVHVQEREIVNLNELEYIEDKIYAKVWHEDVILIVCPQTGKVCGWIDCTSLQDANKKYENVLNGIAYDNQNGTLLITGKRWCNVYRIRMQYEVPPFEVRKDISR
ncbi:MAG: glutaminyl-peptide cyclotransferase, partial [Candidatus Caldatribacteriaceae bacterium]